MRAIDFHQSCHSVFVEGTHCCIVICVCVNYLWFSLTKVSSSSFSLSISCFFSSGLVSPFVILSLGRAERDTQTQSESTSQHNLNHGREERPQEHVMTHAELRTLLRKIWFSIHLACLAVKKKETFYRDTNFGYSTVCKSVEWVNRARMWLQTSLQSVFPLWLVTTEIVWCQKNWLKASMALFYSWFSYIT